MRASFRVDGVACVCGVLHLASHAHGCGRVLYSVVVWDEWGVRACLRLLWLRACVRVGCYAGFRMRVFPFPVCVRACVLGTAMRLDACVRRRSGGGRCDDAARRPRAGVRLRQRRVRTRARLHARAGVVMLGLRGCAHCHWHRTAVRVGVHAALCAFTWCQVISVVVVYVLCARIWRARAEHTLWLCVHTRTLCSCTARHVL